MKLPEAQLRRFWSYVTAIDDDNSCWLWRGPRFVSGGYGRFNVNIDGYNYSLRAHVVSFVNTKGNVPPELQVNHTCDNPLCVRPRHLYAGTHAQNMQDAYDRTRDKADQRTVKREHYADIRKLYETGRYSQSQLARMYNTSQRAISYIVRGKYT